MSRRPRLKSAWDSRNRPNHAYPKRFSGTPSRDISRHRPIGEPPEPCCIPPHFTLADPEVKSRSAAAAGFVPGVAIGWCAGRRGDAAGGGEQSRPPRPRHRGRRPGANEHRAGVDEPPGGSRRTTTGSTSPDLDTGAEPADRFVDEPPYRDSP